MIENEEIEQVARLFFDLGAEKKQASRMAIQLLKRVNQLCEQRNIPKTQALQGLLETAICGARGELRPTDQAGFEPLDS